jgi:vitamin-K-epoxide reductase (warfarin-sensitive)
MVSILTLAIIGFLISAYTYFIEKQIKEKPNYKPVCDLSDRISCTKPMKSPYANLFYVSNSVIGGAYYIMIGVLTLLNMNQVLLLAAVCGCIISALLAYILYFKIKSLCILCTTLYVINVLILLFAMGRI